MSKLEDTAGYIVAEWLRDEGRDNDGVPEYVTLIDLVNRLTRDNRIRETFFWVSVKCRLPSESGYYFCSCDGVVKKKWYFRGLRKFGDADRKSEEAEKYFNENIEYWVKIPRLPEKTDDIISEKSNE